MGRSGCEQDFHFQGGDRSDDEKKWYHTRSKELARTFGQGEEEERTKGETSLGKEMDRIAFVNGGAYVHRRSNREVCRRVVVHAKVEEDCDDKGRSVVGKAQRAVLDYAEKYAMAKRRAEQFRAGATFVVGGDVQFEDIVEVEDVLVPLREEFISARLSEIIDAVENERLLDLETTLVGILEQELVDVTREARRGLDVGNFDALRATMELVDRAGFRQLTRGELQRWDSFERYADRVNVALDRPRRDSPFRNIVDERMNFRNALYPTGLVLWRGVSPVPSPKDTGRGGHLSS